MARRFSWSSLLPQSKGWYAVLARICLGEVPVGASLAVRSAVWRAPVLFSVARATESDPGKRDPAADVLHGAAHVGRREGLAAMGAVLEIRRVVWGCLQAIPLKEGGGVLHKVLLRTLIRLVGIRGVPVHYRQDESRLLGTLKEPREIVVDAYRVGLDLGWRYMGAVETGGTVGHSKEAYHGPSSPSWW